MIYKSSSRYLALVPLALIMLALPFFLQGSYEMNLVVLVGIYSIMAVGMDLLVGYSGQLSLGQNAFFAIGAYTAGIAAVRLGLPSYITFLLALIVTIIAALCIGIPTLRLKGYYLAIATMAFGVIVPAAIVTFPEVSGGNTGLSGIPRLSVAGFAFDDDTKFYFVVWGILAIVLVTAFGIVRSRVGRAVLALSEDELAAEMLGIDLAKYKLQIFLVCALYTGIAGYLYAYYFRFLSPADYELTVSIELLLVMFLGGRRTLWGAIIGTAILKSLPDLLQGLNDYKVIVYGLVFIFILLFAKKGIAGAIISLLSRISKKSSRQAITQPRPEANANA